jgi:hypothetical protein
MKNKLGKRLEIITAEELIKRDFHVPEGTGVIIPGEGRKPFYFVSYHGSFNYVRKKRGKNSEYINVSRIDSKREGKIVDASGYGDSLYIFETDTKNVNEEFKRIKAERKDLDLDKN